MALMQNGLAKKRREAACTGEHAGLRVEDERRRQRAFVGDLSDNDSLGSLQSAARGSNASAG